MNPLEVIKKYHAPDSREYQILTIHSLAVTKKALEIAQKIKKNKTHFAKFFPKEDLDKLDLQFIYEAAMLHDIGFGFPNKGKEKNKKDFSTCYVAHGYWGAEILRKEGLPKHARVAERHVGVGITKEDIEKNKWPIPKANYIPRSIEEIIISYADLFYSKNPRKLLREESKKKIEKEIKSYDKSSEKVKIFKKWEEMLEA